MPLVRISLRAGKPESYSRAVAEAVHRAMVETINVPELDRFQIITEHSASHMVFDPAYLGIERTEDIVFVQVTLNQGRTLEKKKAFYARLAELLEANPGIRREDLLISLVEVPPENWSFGNGEAQYAKP